MTNGFFIKYIFNYFLKAAVQKVAAPAVWLSLLIATPALAQGPAAGSRPIRERISINEGWKFFRYDPVVKADSLIYDVRPKVNEDNDTKPADARPTEAVQVVTAMAVLKPWILPTGNSFIKDPGEAIHPARRKSRW